MMLHNFYCKFSSYSSLIEFGFHVRPFGDAVTRICAMDTVCAKLLPTYHSTWRFTIYISQKSMPSYSHDNTSTDKLLNKGFVLIRDETYELDPIVRHMIRTQWSAVKLWGRFFFVKSQVTTACWTFLITTPIHTLWFFITTFLQLTAADFYARTDTFEVNFTCKTA